MRLRALGILSERTASPSEIAEELGESLGVISYHVRILLDLGCLELVDTAQRRGATEHYYRAIVRPYLDNEMWGQLPATIRRAISSGQVGAIWRDVGAAIEKDTFDSRDNRHLSWTNLALDEQGWEELDALLNDVIARALEIEAESLERVAGSGEDPPPTSKLVLMHFEAARRAPRRRPAKRRAKPRAASKARPAAKKRR